MKQNKQNIPLQERSKKTPLTVLTAVQQARHKKWDLQAGYIISIVTVGCRIFIPMAVCIVRVAVVGLSEAFKLTVFPLLLVPGGGTDSCSEMRRSAAGWSPDTTDSYFPPDAQDRENRELAITRLLSLYILQSWPAPLCCTPLWRLSQGQAGGNESNTLLMDYWCVCICECARVGVWEEGRGKNKGRKKKL